MQELTLIELQEKDEAPAWFTEASLKTLKGGYLLESETPRGMYRRVSHAAANRLNRPDLEPQFFNILWRGWLGLATPVAANMGADRGLPISCFSSYVPDSIPGIFETLREIACMSAYGGGTSALLDPIRSRNKLIHGGGISNGVVPWAKTYNETIYRVSQGLLRRGALSLYLSILHKDYMEFLKIRKPNVDPDIHCPYIHQGAVIPDEFMHRLKEGDKAAREVWVETLNTRLQTGEPYLFFKDNTNNQNPPWYKALGLEVKQSNLCSEVTLYTDEYHSLVCCLSSLNLAKYDEWKDTDTVYLSIWFLDAVMEEFIQRAKHFAGFERAVRFAEKSRALGLGVLGYHTYLQQNGWAFNSDEARKFNLKVFESIQAEADKATRDLAKEYGEPEWCKGWGVRNTHLLACAPTVSNSIICGDVSAGVEPVTANVFAKDSAKGFIPVYNKVLKAKLQELGKDDPDTWQTILEAKGSVAGLTFLSAEDKKVFRTARELDQMEIINQAADRQQFIDQGQSINLFFPANVDSKLFNKVHLEAWKKGLKALYYCRSEAVIEADNAARTGTVFTPSKVDPDCGCPIQAEPKADDDVCIPCSG